MSEKPEDTKNDPSFINNDAEELRIRYKYRRLLVQGRISIPYNVAAKLIGPDSAYRLYASKKNFKDRKKLSSAENNKEPVKE